MKRCLPKLYLASGSPRRRQLLEGLGIKFSVLVPKIEERVGTAAKALSTTRENARAKALAVASRLNHRKFVVLGADTVVIVGRKILGKPRDAREARAYLRMLSGKSHKVVTGLAVLSSAGSCVRSVESRVSFRRLSEKEIRDYSMTREPYDKAGGYAVQGLASVFVTRVEGSYTNVIGLPVEDFLKELAGLTGIPVCEWFR